MVSVVPNRRSKGEGPPTPPPRGPPLLGGPLGPGAGAAAGGDAAGAGSPSAAANMRGALPTNLPVAGSYWPAPSSSPGLAARASWVSMPALILASHRGSSVRSYSVSQLAQ